VEGSGAAAAVLGVAGKRMDGTEEDDMVVLA
jgi:hypothetical protein